MAKILCVLYEDPVDGYPTTYARDDLPGSTTTPAGRPCPRPTVIDFTPGQLLGSSPGSSASASSWRRRATPWWSPRTRRARTRSSSASSADADVVISQPFWPAYLTAERIAKAPKLKLAITAGIGSDHVDLDAAIAAGITVAEVTYSNSISVSEHVVMMILGLVRNYLPSHEWVVKGGWNIADCVERSYDLEGMVVGTVAAGRIGLAVLKRLAPFDVELHYTDRHRLPAEVERGARPDLPPRRRSPWCPCATW